MIPIDQISQNIAQTTDNGIVIHKDGQWEKISYKQFSSDIAKTQEWLSALGVTEGMFVGICASNCYEWLVFDYALINMKCISVCFPTENFKNSSADSLKQQYGLSLLISDGSLDNAHSYSWVIPLNLCHIEKTEATQIYSADTEQTPIDVPGDTYTLVFSSGTSGKLKCLAVSKSGIEYVLSSFGKKLDFRHDDSIIAFLPLSIFQQRWMIYAASYYNFDFLLVDQIRLFNALSELKPTILGAPPLFFETIENRFNNLDDSIRLLLTVIGKVLAQLPKAIRTPLQKRVFAKFHKSLGGRFRLMLIGAAPPKLSTLNFFKMIGLPLFEGYGMTETGYLSINLPRYNKIGTTGREFIDGTLSLSDEGEVIATLEKPLCLGYLFDEGNVENSKTFLPGNKVATGDIGKFDKDGYLSITGRIKEIVITNGGVKVHPETIEKEIEQSCPEVNRAVVFGGESINGLAAILSVRKSDDQTFAKIQKRIDSLNKSQSAGAKINEIQLTLEEFRIDNGYMTRSMKINRRAVYASFGKSATAELA